MLIKTYWCQLLRLWRTWKRMYTTYLTDTGHGLSKHYACMAQVEDSGGNWCPLLFSGFWTLVFGFLWGLRQSSSRNRVSWFKTTWSSITFPNIWWFFSVVSVNRCRIYQVTEWSLVLFHYMLPLSNKVSLKFPRLLFTFAPSPSYLSPSRDIVHAAAIPTPHYHILRPWQHRN